MWWVLEGGEGEREGDEERGRERERERDDPGVEILPATVFFFSLSRLFSLFFLVLPRLRRGPRASIDEKKRQGGDFSR